MMKTELAWAAGFFDGEGCTRVNRCKNNCGVWYAYLMVQVTQKERLVLDRFQNAVGGRGNIYTHKAGHFVYSTGNQDDCHAILELLWPYLSEPKRVQANNAIRNAVGRIDVAA